MGTSIWGLQKRLLIELERLVHELSLMGFFFSFLFDFLWVFVFLYVFDDINDLVFLDFDFFDLFVLSGIFGMFF
ncbi:unnamed protein product [Camellia sinensis]